MLHDVPLSPFTPATVIVYVVVVVGVSVAVPFRVGEVNPVNPARLGEKVGFSPLVYEAVIVTVCPDSIVPVLAVNVQVAHPVGVVPFPSPVQSVLHFPGVPLSAPSSQTSFGLMDRECHGRNVPPCVVIPQLPSVLPDVLSMIPSPHLAT